MSIIPENRLSFTTPADWRLWLEEHHSTEAHAWLLISRRGAHRQFLTLDEALEEALCFGWIQAALQPIDKDTYALRFSPRQPDGIWSVNNIQKAEKLIQQGRMAPAGMEAVNQAQARGEWEAAFDREDVSSIPDDLVQALEEEDAWLGFENWPASKKMQYLYWLEIAKRPATREKRLKTIVALAKSGKRSY